VTVVVARRPDRNLHACRDKGRHTAALNAQTRIG